MDVMKLAHDERADLLDLLTNLTLEQWDAPTLCTEWRVRDVVAHMISYDDLRPRELLGRFAQARFALDRANAEALAEFSRLEPEQLLDALKTRLDPRGLTARFGGRIALVDGMIHQQDIRRPLGASRTIPAERLAPALGFARIAPPIRAFWRARGLRLVATDLDWTAGRGPAVHGPGEAVLLAIAGRPAALAKLSGPGQAILAGRLGGA